MAYDANSGAWKYEDDSVEGRVKGLVSENNPLMQQARTQGMQTANRRGLLNSSIAGGEAQKAVIDKAVPIATADANIVSQKNLSAQGHVQNKEIVGIQEAGQNTRLDKQLTSQERVAEGDRAAAKERLGLELTSREKVALEDRNAENMRSGNQISSNERINTSNNDAAMARTNVTEAGANSRLTISEAGANSRQDSSNRTTVQVAVGNATNNAANARTTAIGAITSNPNIPPAARGPLIAQMETYYESDIRTIAAVYNVQIPYRPPSTVTTQSGTPDSLTPYGGGSFE